MWGTVRTVAHALSVPHPDSSGCMANLPEIAGHREESRRGTLESVRHVGFSCLLGDPKGHDDRLLTCGGVSIRPAALIRKARFTPRRRVALGLVCRFPRRLKTLPRLH